MVMPLSLDWTNAEIYHFHTGKNSPPSPEKKSAISSGNSFRSNETCAVVAVSSLGIFSKGSMGLSPRAVFTMKLLIYRTVYLLAHVILVIGQSYQARIDLEICRLLRLLESGLRNESRKVQDHLTLSTP